MPLSLEARAFVAIQRAAGRLTQQVSQALRPYDLSPTQYNVLRILRGAGPDGLACNRIGAELLTHDPDITRLLDRMEQRGWIARARDTADRRRIQARLTGTGLKLVNSLDRVIQRHHAATLGTLGDRRLRGVVTALESWLEGGASISRDDDNR